MFSGSRAVGFLWSGWVRVGREAARRRAGGMSGARTLPSATPATTSAYSATWAIAPRPVAADGLEAAGCADDRIAAVKAVARHPFMAEREVELHRIRRVDLPGPPPGLPGHPPVSRL